MVHTVNPMSQTTDDMAPEPIDLRKDGFIDLGYGGPLGIGSGGPMWVYSAQDGFDHGSNVHTDHGSTDHRPSSPINGGSGRPESDMNWLTRLGRESIYLLIAWPVWLAAFIVVVTGVATGIGLAVVTVGIPILVLTFLVARVFAEFERLALRHLLEQEVPAGRYRPLPDAHPAVRWLWVLRDPQYWLDVIAAPVMFAVSTATWVITVTWWSTALFGLSFPLWGWARQGSENDSLPALMGLGSGYLIEAAFYLVIGVLAAVTLPFAVRVMTFIQSTISGLLLISRSEQIEQVETLVEGRTAAREAEATALRRLERDIHDGPQQRLVRLSMDLGRAKKQAGTQDAALTETLEGALQQTRDTLEELRALSRGIAPPVLSDRGLRAALEEMAARCPIPMTLRVHAPDEHPLPVHIETALYFVVSEALTNIAKHSGATEAAVTVFRRDASVLVRVTDNGTGGAVIADGHGLAGLRDRVRAVEGTMTVDSPVGGPTVINAEMPCA